MTCGYDADVFDRSVEAQILRLQAKIERNASYPEVICAERSVTNYLNAPVQRVYCGLV